MKFSVLLGSALHSLKGNARRTILTMLGIIIGIAAVITIMSLGKGFQKMAVSGLAGEDNGKVTVQFFYQPDNPQSVRKVEKAFSKQDRIGVESIEGVSGTEIPETKEQNYIFGVSIPTKKSTEHVVLGLEKSATKESLTVGENISQVDIDANKKVAIIDEELAKLLFSSPKQALGHGVTIDGEVYYIKGVKPTSKVDALQAIFTGADPYKAVHIPATTHQHYHKKEENVNGLKVFVKPGYVAKDVAKKVETHLNEVGSKHTSGKYTFIDVAAQMDIIGKVLDGLTYFVSAVAGISLFIAGVGVMNMMYISVSERTKEIGIRRAMGATKGSIQLQFLLEGIMITSIGGIIGYVTGVLLAMLISNFLPFKIYTDWIAVALTVGVSVFIGIVFSVFPAKSAANKDVIEILR